MAVRWSCVEAGLRLVGRPRPTPTTIVPLVQAHIAEVHSSFELEDMIEAVLEDVPDGRLRAAQRG